MSPLCCEFRVWKSFRKDFLVKKKNEACIKVSLSHSRLTMGASTSSPGQAKKEACGGSGQIVVSGALWFVKTDEDVLSLLADLPPPVFSLVLALVCTRVTTMIRLESVCRFLFHTLRGHAPHRLVANPWIAFAQMRRVPELKTREQFVVWSGNQCHPWYSRVMLKQTQNELRAYLLEHGATGMTPSSRIRGLEGLFRIEGLQKKNLILMTGLRGVGKSSILRGLGCAITLTTPIVGVDVETVAFEAGSVECSEIWSWEAGLGLQLKPVWFGFLSFFFVLHFSTLQ